MTSTRLLPLLLLLPCAAAFAPLSLLPRPATGSTALQRRGGVRGLALQLKTQNDPLKNERGNNIGDSRYTTSYSEDLKDFVEDLPAGTTEEQIRAFAQRLRESGLPADIKAGKIRYRNHFSGSAVVDWMLKERIAKNRRVAVPLLSEPEHFT
ncbi:hypothetical protein T484DRAFT_1800416 [Baffinella frigidus]|nr:hypothetical protein T484DRAFT_1800416 [Cryptophyta sp. CCMP2293]